MTPRILMNSDLRHSVWHLLDEDVTIPTESILKGDYRFEGLPIFSEKFELIDTWDAFFEILADLMRVKILSADVETDGLGKLTHRIIGYSFSYNINFRGMDIESRGCLRNVYIPVRHRTGDRSLDPKDVAFYLGKVFLRSDVVFLFWNARFDMHMLFNEGMGLGGLVIDGMIYRKLLFPEDRAGLKRTSEDLVESTAGEWDRCIRVFIRSLCGKNGWKIPGRGDPLARSLYDYIPTLWMAQYAGRDTYYTWLCVDLLLAMIRDIPGLMSISATEHSLILPLFRMERNGLPVDRVEVGSSVERAFSIQKKLERSLEEDFGFSGNLRKDSDVISFLRDQGAIFTRATRGTRHLPPEKQNMSLAGDVLRMQAVEGVVASGLVYQWRTLFDILSRNLLKLSEYIEGDGCVHASFMQLGAKSGRMSANAPNVMNVPQRNEYASLVRTCYRLKSNDWEWWFLDLNQIELRIIAHCSKDPHLCDAFIRGEDLHVLTAIDIFGLDVWDRGTLEEKSLMRSIAKEANFGIVYGIGAKGLADNLFKRGILRSVESCEEVIFRFKSQRPRLMQWVSEVKVLAHRQGYIDNLYGRRKDCRLLSDMSVSRYEREKLEQSIPNFMGQGTAADFFKRFWISFEDALFSRLGAEYKFVNWVHDEIQVFIRPTDRNFMIEESQRVLDEESACFDVPISLNYQRSLGSWDEKEEISL